MALALDVGEAVSRVLSCPDMAALEQRMVALVAPLGLTGSAGGMLTGKRARTIYFMSWNREWAKLYQARNYWVVDPLIRYASVSGEAATWSEIYAGFPSRDPGQAVLREARRFGYVEGFATPVRLRNGALGLVSVGGGAQRRFSVRERMFLEAMSVAALRHADRFYDDMAPAPAPALLSQREREMVELLRSGLTDAEIAKTVCIGIATVRTYIESARTKLAARNRTHLASMTVS